MIGEYIYHSDDKGTPHEPDRLTLGADGKYILVRLAHGDPETIKRGTWRLLNKQGPTVVLDHAGYPVEIRKQRFRLLINIDLGHYYDKVSKEQK